LHFITYYYNLSLDRFTTKHFLEFDMEPIILTEIGEMLIVNSELGPLTDNSCLQEDCHIGIHYICRGFIDLKPVSLKYNAILCRSCKLRIVIPRAIITYGDLRSYFERILEL